jgi:hypothetical protein
LLFFGCFFLFRKSLSKKVQTRKKNFGLIFSGPEETHEASGEDQKSHEEAASHKEAINSQIFPIYQKDRRENLFATASLCFSAIPSGGLFRYSAAGGIDHGGLLHQPCCPSDDV